MSAYGSEDTLRVAVSFEPDDDLIIAEQSTYTSPSSVIFAKEYRM